MDCQLGFGKQEAKRMANQIGVGCLLQRGTANAWPLDGDCGKRDYSTNADTRMEEMGQ